MGRTVQDVMDFALLGGRTERERVDLAAVVADVLADLGGVSGDARIEVDDLPTVHANEGQVRAVLQNLVSNAIKFTAPHSTSEIRIRADVGGGTSRVWIIDNGPGVPADRRSAIFDLMVRGDNESVEGHGIGLATCARIVRTYGGQVGVDEAPGGGAAFWFELPSVPV